MYKAIKKCKICRSGPLTGAVSSPHQSHKVFTPEEKVYSKMAKCNQL